MNKVRSKTITIAMVSAILIISLIGCGQTEEDESFESSSGADAVDIVSGEQPDTGDQDQRDAEATEDEKENIEGDGSNYVETGYPLQDDVDYAINNEFVAVPEYDGIYVVCNLPESYDDKDIDDYLQDEDGMSRDEAEQTLDKEYKNEYGDEVLVSAWEQVIESSVLKKYDKNDLESLVNADVKQVKELTADEDMSYLEYLKDCGYDSEEEYEESIRKDLLDDDDLLEIYVARAIIDAEGLSADDPDKETERFATDSGFNSVDQMRDQYLGEGIASGQDDQDLVTAELFVAAHCDCKDRDEVHGVQE